MYLLEPTNANLMKTPFLVASVLAALAAGSLLAQESAPQPVPALPRFLPTRAAAAPMQAATPQAPQPLAPSVAAPELVYVDPATGLPVPTKVKRFDLDFPGGGPADFIRVVSEARGKPVNAIIPDDLADTRLPEMHLKQVTVPQLFEALEAASHKMMMYKTGSYFAVPNREVYDYSQQETTFGFRTKGPVNDDSIWTFHYEKPNLPPESAPARVVRFYQLGPYLDAYKFDDITTAIQTGWKMLGETSPPTMNFHKETKLLIAVGEPAQLQIIEEVLSQLATAPKPKTPSRLGSPRPTPQVQVPPLPPPAPAQ